MAAGTISVYQGNTLSLPITVTSTDGSFTLDGVTIFFTVKLRTDQRHDDNQALITKSITPTSSTTAVLELTETDTNILAGDYDYDFKFKKASQFAINSTNGIFTVREPITFRDE